MYYIVRVGSDYIADGNNYTVQGESFVPFTGKSLMLKNTKLTKWQKEVQKDVVKICLEK